MIDGLILTGAVAAGYFRLFQTLLWTSGCAMLAIAFFGHGSNLWGAVLGAAAGLWVDLRSHSLPQPWRIIAHYSGVAVFLMAVIVVLIGI